MRGAENACAHEALPQVVVMEQMRKGFEACKKEDPRQQHLVDLLAHVVVDVEDSWRKHCVGVQEVFLVLVELFTLHRPI